MIVCEDHFGPKQVLAAELEMVLRYDETGQMDEYCICMYTWNLHYYWHE